MKNLKFFQWVRLQSINVKSSIAFYPALIALGFLFLSFLALRLEETEWVASIKSAWQVLDLRDANTARTIVGTIATGIISLTVFSFSMVMIVLSQAASNMTNRLLDLMINNRFQQITLGIYIGTFVYALFLFTIITENSPDQPGLSIFILMVMAVIDIFLFIYFLHYITQAVKIDTNIRRIGRETMHALEKHFPRKTEEVEKREKTTTTGGKEIIASVSGYFQEYRKNELIKLCKENDWQVEILIYPGNFVLKGTPVLKVWGKEPGDKSKELLSNLDLYDKQNISSVPYWGFHQLMEIALKALSPGINDPVSAVRSLNKLVELLLYRLLHSTANSFEDDEGNIRLYFDERNTANIVKNCLLPIWDYGRNDRQVVEAIYNLTNELLSYFEEGEEMYIVQKLHKAAGERIDEFKL